MTMCYSITFSRVTRDPEQDPRDPKKGLELGNHDIHPYADPAIDKFNDSIRALPEFQAIPETTQRLISQIGENALIHAGISATLFRKPLFWEMYLIGSRARHENRATSDTDLLCVGNFNLFNDLSDCASPLDGFAISESRGIPPSYLVGYTSGKSFFMRLIPEGETTVSTINQVDLSIVHLNPLEVPSLSVFKREKDVDKQGNQLARIPLLTINVVDLEAASTSHLQTA